LNCHNDLPTSLKEKTKKLSNAAKLKLFNKIVPVKIKYQYPVKENYNPQNFVVLVDIPKLSPSTWRRNTGRNESILIDNLQINLQPQ
jgi:hypothetical protein